MTKNNETLNTKTIELIDAFQNLKDYITFNNLPHAEKCESLLNEVKKLKAQIEEDIDSQKEFLAEKIELLSKSFDNLKNEFVK